MPRQPLPPVAVVVSFVDAINHGDVDRLGELMTDDHRLVVFDEDPLVGRQENIDAWRGYVESFSDYVIHPHRITEPAPGMVALLGHTTGSHLGLPDDEEARETLIWLVDVHGGAVCEWRLVPDDAEQRQRLGLGPAPASASTASGRWRPAGGTEGER